MTDLRVGIPGASGRMGRMLLEAALTHDAIALGSASVRAGNAFEGMDAGLLVGQPEAGVRLQTSLSDLVKGCDAVIDFTQPELTMALLDLCVAEGKAIIIGTTGLSADQVNRIELAAESIPVVYAPNMSVGVNLCFKLLEQAAAVIGADSDIEVYEAHHRHKKDAPSGTALKMGEVVADTLGRNLSDCAVYGREGITGERDRETIGFATVRAGDIIGDHTVTFALGGERVEITHKSSSRATYAQGSMRAACWLKASSMKPGLYDMQDVLGLKG